MPSAYVVLICEGGTGFLVADKQVLSYQALANQFMPTSLNRRHLKEIILAGLSTLLTNGHIPNCRNFKRFGGALLPGMGKETLPGGGVNPEELTSEADGFKVAAARELIEEFHLKTLLKLDDKGIEKLKKKLSKALTLIHTEGHGQTPNAKFYWLNFDPILHEYGTDVKTFMHSFNQLTTNFENELKPNTTSLVQLISKLRQSKKELPELRRIKLIPIDECKGPDLFRDDGESQREYMTEQLDLFSNLVCNFIATADSKFKEQLTDELIATMGRHLFDHATKNEPLEWFRHAMYALNTRQTASQATLFKSVQLRVKGAGSPKNPQCTCTITINCR